MNTRSNTNPNRAPWLRRYWVNPPFQARVILTMVLTGLVVVLTTLATTNYFFYDLYQKGFAAGLSEENVFFTFIKNRQTFMNQLMVGVSAFIFGIIMLMGMILSHRVAGPLYRLNKHMCDVANGKVSEPVAFRKSDFFQELATSYNAQYQYLTSQQPHQAEDPARQQRPS